MSLIVGIDLNRSGDGLGLIEISRRKGTNASDSRNTYEYFVWDHLRNKVGEGKVTHRYGDGAIRLLYVALKDFYESP